MIESAKRRREALGAALAACGVLAAVAVGPGCDWESRLGEARDAVVARHRLQAKGKVGVLRALEVGDRASAIARALDRRGLAVCGGVPRAPFEAHIVVEAEATPRGFGDNTRAWLREERTVRVDAHGGVEVVHVMTFGNPRGREGETRREERLVGGAWFVKEHNVPFIRRDAHSGDAERLVSRALDPIPSVLQAGQRGWRQESPDVATRFAAEDRESGRRLTCGLPEGDSAWVARLLGRGELSMAHATLERTPEGTGTRLASLRLVAEDERERPVIVRVDVEEQVTAAPDTPRVEAPEVVAEIKRDRPYRDIQQILERRLGLGKDGWAPLGLEHKPDQDEAPEDAPSDAPDPRDANAAPGVPAPGSAQAQVSPTP